ncbi:MAG: glycosyltransferase family 2 protein [Candidatus Caldatribacterium sp.]|uniref:glycosyltransferase family 2 protein n=1 Tax=Candidatus Caldatribacterium sp. TaxID=2282143 RepID=UPI0029938850|nr:glycosyltransferase family 2 protein [Candidatus Caldatribacterium sp.]MCX7731346.1 glycosyltransferase family 2 protein [Candidatus Caldatribacterium sp.]MDW8081888.1 glycosyltransferase family 2 protein [Candidatus Calescibacterium sp.]
MRGVRLSVVVPVFNEEEVLPETYRRLTEVMEGLALPYEIVFVDDGSKDQSPRLLDELARRDPRVRVIHFSRNFGHQAAITAGLDYARGEAVVVIDADLQDPPEVIPEMVAKWQEGYEVVYGQRVRREGETLFKRLTASFFYRLLRFMTDIDIPLDTGDFRLMDRKVVEVMKLLREKNRFIRGLVAWVGFRQIALPYVRHRRLAGTTKYPLRKMLRLAWDGITAFSNKPLKVAAYLGLALSLFSFLYLVAIVVAKLLGKSTVPGWASLAVMNLFFSGIILIILGIMGEYLGRMYEEAKNRPLYIVDRIVEGKPDAESS